MTDPIAIRKLIEGVTEGPWRAGAWGYVVHGTDPNLKILACCSDADDEESNTEQSHKNAEFIAAARTLVPQLLDEVERLTKARDEMRDALRFLFNNPFDHQAVAHAGLILAASEAAARIAELEAAPGHTDLMVSPESLDKFLEENPPPAEQEAKHE